MTLPLDGSDDEQQEPQGVYSYKITCIDFIKDISKDYLAWVDRYKLSEQEDGKRRIAINSIITKTNDWIAKVAQSIKAIDVVMNDGIQKMAEATAGQPFPIGIFVNNLSQYTLAKPGMINIKVKSNSNSQDKKTSLGFHFKGTRFRIESTCGAFIVESNLDITHYDMLDLDLVLDAAKAMRNDVISFTITISEINNGLEIDKRGMTTLVHIL